MSISYSLLLDTGARLGPGIHSSYGQQMWRQKAKDGLEDLRTDDQRQIQNKACYVVRILTGPWFIHMVYTRPSHFTKSEPQPK